MTQLQRFLKEKLDERGMAQNMVEFLGIAPGTITGWKKGNRIGFRAGLQIAWYFCIPPEEVYEMAEAPKLAEMFRGLFPNYEGVVLTESDLYRDPCHAELHEQLEYILQHGSADDLELVNVAIARVYKLLLS